MGQAQVRFDLYHLLLHNLTDTWIKRRGVYNILIFFSRITQEYSLFYFFFLILSSSLHGPGGFDLLFFFFHILLVESVIAFNWLRYLNFFFFFFFFTS